MPHLRCRLGLGQGACFLLLDGWCSYKDHPNKGHQTLNGGTLDGLGVLLTTKEPLLRGVGSQEGPCTPQ